MNELYYAALYTSSAS